jgi:REP element-mobilizing transposase RayT
MQTLRLHDGVKYELDAAVVMPDHLHLLLKPLPKKNGFYSLSEIFHSIKGFVAHRGSGTLWQDDNYDHIIRNEKDHNEKLIYLINNPVEAGLVERYQDYRWLYVKGLVDWRVELPVVRPRR